MSTKPILFNTDMVRALQNGTKTVTRRVVKAQHLRVLDSPYHRQHPETPDKVLLERLCAPPYRPGDILYVRETWAEWWLGGYIYKADNPDRKFDVGNWAPSIHMPREAARIFLRVTDVRVERLQDPFFKHGSTISSLRGEGIDIGEQCRECIETYGSPCCIDDESECGVLDEVRGDFSVLWNRTIKPADLAKYSWGVNPWVWVIEFERCEKPKEGN